nr:MAG TPA: hypothetical protein [Caudoviricetes sp.]
MLSLVRFSVGGLYLLAIPFLPASLLLETRHSYLLLLESICFLMKENAILDNGFSSDSVPDAAYLITASYTSSLTSDGYSISTSCHST